jgi:predicted dehydrogenase
VTPFRVGVIGAGTRARVAHLPSIARLQEEGAVRLVAICDLDEQRLATSADRYGVGPAGRYTDYHSMLREAELDVVYATLQPTQVLPIVRDVLDAGVHAFTEKPPGVSAAETQQLVNAAERSGRWAMVGAQRRYTPVGIEAQRQIAERGPLTMCLATYHKDMVTNPAGLQRPRQSTLIDDMIHVVDLCRYVCGGRVDETPEVHALQAQYGGAEWPNCYNAVVRFASGAQAVISGNRSSGGRTLRVELHGIGIGCYIDPFPDQLRVLTNNGKDDTTVSGAQLASSDERLDYDGTFAAHRHFVECLREHRQPLTDVRDVIATMRLLEQLESPFWLEDAPARAGN